VTKKSNIWAVLTKNIETSPHGQRDYLEGELMRGTVQTVSDAVGKFHSSNKQTSTEKLK
jgi:hypothetical protein